MNIITGSVVLGNGVHMEGRAIWNTVLLTDNWLFVCSTFCCWFGSAIEQQCALPLV